MTPESNLTSDDNLRKSLLAKFAADDRFPFADLRVGVANGIVHLAGAVSSIEARNSAAKLAKETPGIRGVVNRIEAPGAPSPGRTIHLDLSTKKEGNHKLKRSCL
jgi:osmotically-inducible protein OsmY